MYQQTCDSRINAICGRNFDIGFFRVSETASAKQFRCEQPTFDVDQKDEKNFDGGQKLQVCPRHFEVI